MAIVLFGSRDLTGTMVNVGNLQNIVLQGNFTDSLRDNNLTKYIITCMKNKNNFKIV